MNLEDDKIASNKSGISVKITVEGGKNGRNALKSGQNVIIGDIILV